MRSAAKDAYRFSLEMSARWRAELAAANPTSSRCGRRTQRSEGIGDFLEGKYRPGLPPA